MEHSQSPTTKPRLGIIGAGKVGCTLARLLYAAGYTIEAVYSRTAFHAGDLAKLVNATAASSPPLGAVDYISAADAATLKELYAPIDAPILLSLTVQIGKPRLLDNCLLPFSLNTREGLTKTLGGVIE